MAAFKMFLTLRTITLTFFLFASFLQRWRIFVGTVILAIMILYFVRMHNLLLMIHDSCLLNSLDLIIFLVILFVIRAGFQRLFHVSHFRFGVFIFTSFFQRWLFDVCMILYFVGIHKFLFTTLWSLLLHLFPLRIISLFVFGKNWLPLVCLVTGKFS